MELVHVLRRNEVVDPSQCRRSLPSVVSPQWSKPCVKATGTLEGRSPRAGFLLSGRGPTDVTLPCDNYSNVGIASEYPMHEPRKGSVQPQRFRMPCTPTGENGGGREDLCRGLPSPRVPEGASRQHRRLHSSPQVTAPGVESLFCSVGQRIKTQRPKDVFHREGYVYRGCVFLPIVGRHVSSGGNVGSNGKGEGHGVRIPLAKRTAGVGYAPGKQCLSGSTVRRWKRAA